MQYSKPSKTAFSILILVTTTLAAPGLSQSGRGRPKIPQPSPTTSQPPPVISVPPAAAVIKQEQVGTTSRFVLRNGITIVISEHHATPIAAAVAYFKAGALDEPWSMSGTQQLVERMIFNGTVLRPGDRALGDLRTLGASIEAGTSYDGAAYSVVAPSDKIKEALTIQADMLQNPKVDAEALRREIATVIEETRGQGVPLVTGLTPPSHAFTTRTFTADPSDQALTRLKDFDDPAAFSMVRLFNIAFTSGASVNIDALRSVTREQLVEFYRSHYRPDNLIVSVAGDVSTFSTLVEIQQLYGDFGVKPEPAVEQVKAAEVIKTKTPSARAAIPTSDNQQQTAKPNAPKPETLQTVKPSPPAEQTKLRYAADRGDISQSIVSVGFNVPGAESKDWAVLEVLAAVAGRGRASRLSRSLIDGQMVANRIEAHYVAVAGAGLVALQTWSSKDSREGSSIDKAESALFKEVDRLRREIPAEGELARAKTILEKTAVAESATYLGRAKALARAEVAGVGFRAALDYRSRIRAISAQDVQRAAAKYLTLGHTSIHEYEPLSAPARTFDADTLSATVTAWAPGFAQPVESAIVQTADANSSLAAVAQGPERSPERQSILESVQPMPVKDFSTLNGSRAFVREDHAQHEVAIAILFQGGRLVEEATTSGATELMLRSILYGTPRRTFAQVTQELEQLGADIEIVAEPDFFGFMLSVLSRNADRALKLLRDMIEEPAFRDDDVARARLGQIASIRDARDSSFTRSRELLLQALFPGHPYSLPSHGREEIVGAFTAEKLREWHARAIVRQFPLAIIVGDTDGSALVSSQIAEGFKRRDVDAALQVRTARPAAAGEKSEQRRLEQATIAVGFAGPKAESADLTAVQLIESAMNGRGGRLLRELRDKQNLISMGGFEHQTMFAAGVIAAYSATRAENEQKARAALLAEFERLARGGLTADEMASSRALATTSRIALQQSHSQHALQYARAIFHRQQASASDVDNFAELLSKVTSEDIKRIAGAYLKVSSAGAGIVRGTPQQPVLSPPKQD
ncbi:MAG: pitrilysin family protein [Acidobacteriota bacterium]